MFCAAKTIHSGNGKVLANEMANVYYSQNLIRTIKREILEKT
jgi:hypothetical protein